MIKITQNQLEVLRSIENDQKKGAKWSVIDFCGFNNATIHGLVKRELIFKTVREDRADPSIVFNVARLTDFGKQALKENKSEYPPARRSSN